MSSKDTVEGSVSNIKKFKYSKKDVNLEFSLTTDNSSQLRSFLACLKQAQADIEEALSEMKN